MLHIFTKFKLLSITILTITSAACNNAAPINETLKTKEIATANNPTNQDANTIKDRFVVPNGYQRINPPNQSFKSYLQNLKLKPEGSTVKYFNGGTKAAEGVYTAVVDLNIGNKDLHQCADAIMRLRAEHLWETKQFDRIHFNLTNGFKVDYTPWMNGKRIVVDGNKTYWDNGNSSSNEYEDFWDYLELIFMYAGTASLEKELQSVPIMDMEIGDIFIQGGFPGHAVIVLDMAIEETTGNKLFLLGQSYMPAQELQVLINPNHKDQSPWYSLNDKKEITTPEWKFSPTDLKRFDD